MFLTDLILKPDPQPRLWVLVQDLVWEDDIFGRLTVPCGFRTDLASVPPVVRDIPNLDPNGLSRRPAAMHDWLYAWRGIGKDNADLFLRQALLAEGATAQTAELFYDGVHDFGQSAWDSDAGALQTRDFDTQDHFTEWRATLSPTFNQPLPDVL